MWPLLTQNAARIITALCVINAAWTWWRARKDQRMHLDLPTGMSVELRDRLKAKDKFAAQAAVRIDMGTNGEVSAVSGGIMTMVQTALLARLLEAWSLDQPLPGAHSCPECVGNSARWHEHVADYIGDILDLDDYAALEYWLAPYMDKVMEVPNPGMSSASGESS